ncbi:MAG: response regulator [Thiotrichales bacterium]|nr:response regulator [Thiotrichales bacterium]
MKKVMIVDDAATVRMYHGDILRQAGYEVVEAFNGVEALEKVLASPVDLMLVDINMPLMDGYSFLREVRMHNDTMHIPAIMISTESEQSDREKAYLNGANDYMIKPVRPDVLLEKVRLMTGG